MTTEALMIMMLGLAIASALFAYFATNKTKHKEDHH